MRKTWNIWLGVATVAGLLVCASGVAAGQGSQSQPPAQQSDKPKTPEVTPLTLDALAPVNAEEDAAYKAFQAVNPNDAAKKIETGEAFLLKYPESRYKSPIYGALTYAYLQAGNTQKRKSRWRRTTSLRSRYWGRHCLGACMGAHPIPLPCRCWPKQNNIPSKPSRLHQRSPSPRI